MTIVLKDGYHGLGHREVPVLYLPVMHSLSGCTFSLVHRSPVWQGEQHRLTLLTWRAGVVIWTGNVNLLMLLIAHPSSICSLLSFNKILQCTSWKSIKDEVLRRRKVGLIKESFIEKSQSRCHERGTEPLPRILGKNRDFYSTCEPRTKSWNSLYKRQCSLAVISPNRTLWGEIKRN